MKAQKILLLITAGAMASGVNARDRKLDIDVQINSDASQSAASMEQSHFLIRNRQYGLAVDGLRKIIRSQPDNAKAYSAIAVAYDGLGRPDLARKNFEMALAYAPLEERHYRNLARHLDTNGERALARNIMNDFEIARAQKAQDNVSPVMEPALDITALLTRLDRENPSVASKILDDRPSDPAPEAPVKRDSAIVIGDDRRPSKSAAILEPDNVGNGTSGDKGGGQDATTGGTEQSYAISSTTIDDLDATIADIYKGLGIADAELDASIPDPEKAEPLEQIARSHASFSDEHNVQTASIQSEPNLADWLNNLSEHQADGAREVQLLERQKPSRFTPMESQVSTGNFQLVRQSLGEVLLTSKRTDFLTPKPVRSASRAIDSLSQQKRLGARQEDAGHYLAAIRSVVDSGANRSAMASTDVLATLAMKQLDVAMADLAKKRHSRLPRIDQGPSRQLRTIAAMLYREADAARTFRLPPARQNIRVTLFYRNEAACVA